MSLPNHPQQAASRHIWILRSLTQIFGVSWFLSWRFGMPERDKSNISINVIIMSMEIDYGKSSFSLL